MKIFKFGLLLLILIGLASVGAATTAQLSLEKTATPTAFTAVGDQITYTYTVKNIGNQIIKGPITVTDNKISGIITIADSSFELAPGKSKSGTATYSITQADFNSGSVTNTARASGKCGTSTIYSNYESATVYKHTHVFTSDGTTSSCFVYGNSVKDTVTSTYAAGDHMVFKWYNPQGVLKKTSKEIVKVGITYANTYKIPAVANSVGTWNVDVTEYDRTYTCTSG